jgi:hypothetical protein
VVAGTQIIGSMGSLGTDRCSGRCHTDPVARGPAGRRIYRHSPPADHECGCEATCEDQHDQDQFKRGGGGRQAQEGAEWPTWFQDMIIIPALQAQTQGAGPLNGCFGGRGGGGWQAGNPSGLGMRYLAGATGPTPSTPPLAKTTSRRNRRRLPRFVLAEFTEENYQVVWWIMASSALSLRFSLHLSRARGYSEAFLDVAPNPNRAGRPPDHELGEHGGAPGQAAPSDLSSK